MSEVLTLPCGVCGEVMPSGLRACGECGSPLTPTSPPTANPPSVPVPAPVDALGGEPAEEEVALGATNALAVEPVSPSSVAENVASDGAGRVTEDEPEPLTVLDAVDPALPAGEAVSAAPVVSPRPTAPVGFPPRRIAVLSVVCAAAVAVVGSAVFAGSVLLSGGAGSPSTAPRPTVTANTARIVTLPGYAVSPAWSVDGVDAAVVSAEHVLTVSGSTLEWRTARAGEVAASAEISGSDVRVLSGVVSGVPAAAAVSDTEALVFVDGNTAPLRVALNGRSLEVRSGAFIVAGPDRTFWVVTATGEVPVSAPRPAAIVLGVPGEAIAWASAPSTVSVASANGTVLSEIALTPPVAGATITPRTGWVRAVTPATVVVGWTLPDGAEITGVHAATTGELLSTVSGTGEGVLSPDGGSWTVDHHLVDLSAATVTPLPEGFVASRFLGRALFGATADGADALFVDGTVTPAPTAPTVRAIAAGEDDILLTLTAGELAAFAPAP